MDFTRPRELDGRFVIAATGSRSLATTTSEEQARVRDALAAEVDRVRVRYGTSLIVMSGMAEGFDEAVARAAVDADVEFWTAIPNRSYGRHYWGRQSRTGRDRTGEFTEFVERADHVTFIAEEVAGTTSLYVNGRHMNFVRNDYMVAVANAFWVYDTGRSAGTADCVRSIASAGLPYKHLGPPVGPTIPHRPPRTGTSGQPSLFETAGPTLQP